MAFFNIMNMGFEQGLEKKKEGGALIRGEALIREYTVIAEDDRCCCCCCLRIQQGFCCLQFYRGHREDDRDGDERFPGDEGEVTGEAVKG